jgi:hypothetical protein
MKMNRAEHIQSLCEGYRYSDLKDQKIPLEPEERETAMKAGAVWHFSHNNSPSCAIWKAKTKSGKILYGCNTHRAMAVKPTLKGAIKAFKFIETTA